MQTYPGSTTPIGTVQPTEQSMDPRDILEGLRKRTVRVGSSEMDMYAIGELASALGRKSGTLRKWEELGILPQATYVMHPSTEQGRRRMYSADQVVGIVRIASEEGILYSPRNAIKDTAFVSRVRGLFNELLGSVAA